MNSRLPQEYITQCFLMYAGYATVHYNSNLMSGGCPSCREGRSWGSKKRLFYIPDHYRMHCKNCNRSWTPEDWIIEVSGKSYWEVIEESKDYEYVPAELICKELSPMIVKTSTLPDDAIDLFDPLQLDYYSDNLIVIEALSLIKNRKIDVAINNPKSIYISLSDYAHKNRLIIPFYDDDGSLLFYQSRTILSSDKSGPKYLGKTLAQKTIYGLDSIDTDLECLFIFEGPIDAMFVKNGVAIAGVTLSSHQDELLNKFTFHKRIWVLDNQHIDETAREKTKELIDEGQNVFLWPKAEHMKDFNDIAIKSNINEIPTKFILQNTFSGLRATLQLRKLGL